MLVVTSSGGNFTLQQLTDGDLGTTNLLPRDTAKGFGWIQFAFAAAANYQSNNNGWWRESRCFWYWC